MQDLVEKQLENTIVSIIESHTLPSVLATAITTLITRGNNILRIKYEEEKLNYQIINEFIDVTKDLSRSYPDVANFLRRKAYETKGYKDQIHAMEVVVSMLKYGKKERAINAIIEIVEIVDNQGGTYWNNLMIKTTY